MRRDWRTLVLIRTLYMPRCFSDTLDFISPLELCKTHWREVDERARVLHFVARASNRAILPDITVQPEESRCEQFGISWHVVRHRKNIIFIAFRDRGIKIIWRERRMYIYSLFYRLTNLNRCNISPFFIILLIKF